MTERYRGEELDLVAGSEARGFILAALVAHELGKGLVLIRKPGKLVRVHGGGSRITSPRQGFRLYFRRRYGPREFAPGILFSPEAQPISRLIVHNDVRRDSDLTRWYFVNPLAYDLAGAMGAIVPETKAVRFYLNGEYYGPFVLTERFDQRFFAAHWGHGDVLVSQEAFDGLWDWVQRTRPLTMDQVATRVDLENLTRWFLAMHLLTQSKNNVSALELKCQIGRTTAAPP